MICMTASPGTADPANLRHALFVFTATAPRHPLTGNGSADADEIAARLIFGDKPDWRPTEPAHMLKSNVNRVIDRRERRAAVLNLHHHFTNLPVQPEHSFTPTPEIAGLQEGDYRRSFPSPLARSRPE